MTLRKIGLALTILSASVLTARGPARAQGPGFSDAGRAALNDQMNQAVARGDAPAIVEIVVNSEGVLYKGAEGLPTDAIFNIASMTKPVTSVAIMMLAEQGKLKLDDPVSKFLDGYDTLQVISTFHAEDVTYETRPAKTAMTIRHLLSHTSGIGYGFTNPIVKALAAKTNKGELELPLLDEPGSKFNYSASTRVLGLIVEKLTGSQLEPWYQEHIFKALGMVDTSYAVPAEKQSRLAPQFTRVAGTIEPLPPPRAPATPTAPMRGDGGLYSTVEDYGRFVRMLLNGGTLDGTRILSKSSVKLMGRNAIGRIFVQQQPDADQQRTRPFPLGAGKDKFGLGFQIAAADPATKGFRSPGSMSWAGIFNTEFWVDPVKHIGGVHMMQLLPFYDDGAIRALRGFEQTVYRNLPLRQKRFIMTMRLPFHASLVGVALLFLLLVGAGRAQAPDTADVAEGMRLYLQKGDCQACHGWAADGRKMDSQMPDAPNLRETRLNRERLVQTIKCGRPGTGMPAYDKFAYSDGRCYGMKQADLKSPMPDPPTTFQPREINLVADFLFAKVVGKGPMDRAKCVEYWGSDVDACREFPK